jgi:hypothetical protein
MRLAEILAERSIPTILPLAAGERRRRGLLYESYLIVREREDLSDLESILVRGREGPCPPEELIRRYGRLLRLMHDRGIYQDDVGLNNCLVSTSDAMGEGTGPMLYIIDMERVRVGPPLEVSKRAWNLGILHFDNFWAPRRWKIEFLKGYSTPGGVCGTGAPGRDILSLWLQRCREATARVEAWHYRRTKKNCRTPGDVFQPYREGEIAGFFRKKFGHKQPRHLFGLDAYRPIIARFREEALGREETLVGAKADREGVDRERSAEEKEDISYLRGETAERLRLRLREAGLAYAVRLRHFPPGGWLSRSPGLSHWMEQCCLFKVRRSREVPMAYFELRAGRKRGRGVYVFLEPGDKGIEWKELLY